MLRLNIKAPLSHRSASIKFINHFRTSVHYPNNCRIIIKRGLIFLQFMTASKGWFRVSDSNRERTLGPLTRPFDHFIIDLSL
jgi:hypothetical protein